MGTGIALTGGEGGSRQRSGVDGPRVRPCAPVRAAPWV